MLYISNFESFYYLVAVDCDGAPSAEVPCEACRERYWDGSCQSKFESNKIFSQHLSVKFPSKFRQKLDNYYKRNTCSLRVFVFLRDHTLNILGVDCSALDLTAVTSEDMCRACAHERASWDGSACNECKQRANCLSFLISAKRNRFHSEIKTLGSICLCVFSAKWL